ncbi:glutathione S-transferase C-terminal domain-containing protein isoform X4 [Salvelinus alpinus]|uniref:glutathione S-transferase C-terminal domain-containing protein isoform X4 n=1 Tax=Salvelinus alpinus TaxID=8036 RepID=UPI0039FC4A8E
MNLPPVTMTQTDPHEEQQPECLYLELSSQNEQPSVPLHTSISLFLLSYCECTSFKVFLVSAKPDTQSSQSWKSQVPKSLAVSMVHVKDLPVLVRGCRLPAVLDETGRYCRAGLAVVLRHIIDRTCEADPRRKDAASLLGFKKTCLKACAEVSQWTRLCELSIPSAVEAHLRQPTNPSLHLPSALLNLEKTLGEPVKVHNDDKIRRQKLQQQKKNQKKISQDLQEDQGTDITQPQDSQSADGLELRAALAKLYVDSGAVPSTTTRESSDIRKVKTTELPQLEHVFAEGLYFTLTDVVLLPCIHQYLESGIQAVFSPHPCPSWTLPWDSLPEAVNPTEGKMSDVRAARKRQQLNNLVAMVTELARPGDTVVDFCSGGGHVGIVLAHTLPDCQVILIENKEESLVRGKVRSAELGLTNIGFIHANLDYFTGPFHIGVALHACGVATDMVVEQCIQAGATFVVSPCCYGFVQNTLKFTFPRSKRFLETLSYKEHMILCRFADQTAVQLPSEQRLIGKQCMGLVDLDRSWAAETHGYSVRVMTMEPDSCSPKNNMLVGVAGGGAGGDNYATQ